MEICGTCSDYCRLNWWEGHCGCPMVTIDEGYSKHHMAVDGCGFWRVSNLRFEFTLAFELP